MQWWWWNISQNG
jgi:hypothetical protein